MTDFRRPIPNRQNELLRKNLSAPAYDLESLSEKSEKGSKLYDENLALEKRLNKRFLEPTGNAPSLKQSISQATDEQKNVCNS